MVKDDPGPHGKPSPRTQPLGVSFRQPHPVSVKGVEVRGIRTVLVAAMGVESGSETLVDLMSDANDTLHAVVRRRTQVTVFKIKYQIGVQRGTMMDGNVLIGVDGFHLLPRVFGVAVSHAGAFRSEEHT